jgi:hypothetical protein
MSIQIITDDKLASYTHAASEQTARDLVKRIEALRADGYEIIEAIGSRLSVPNSYKSTFGMTAPAYQLVGETVVLTRMQLGRRFRGNPIPACFTLAGVKAPEGYFCRRRNRAANFVVVYAKN